MLQWNTHMLGIFRPRVLAKEGKTVTYPRSQLFQSLLTTTEFDALATAGDCTPTPARSLRATGLCAFCGRLKMFCAGCVR
jgi:hypothetical protein